MSTDEKAVAPAPVQSPENAEETRNDDTATDPPPTTTSTSTPTPTLPPPHTEPDPPPPPSPPKQPPKQSLIKRRITAAFPREFPGVQDGSLLLFLPCVIYLSYYISSVLSHAVGLGSPLGLNRFLDFSAALGFDTAPDFDTPFTRPPNRPWYLPTLYDEIILICLFLHATACFWILVYPRGVFLWIRLIWLSAVGGVGVVLVVVGLGVLVLLGMVAFPFLVVWEVGRAIGRWWRGEGDANGEYAGVAAACEVEEVVV